MPNDPAASYAALRAPLPPRNEIIAQSLYWYPNELAVTVHAEKMPTLPQLRDLSARLHRLLSRVGISIVPFYSGGPVISRAGARESAKKQQAKPTKTTGRKAAAIEVGITPITMRVKASLYKQWTREVQECGSDGRFRGVHFFGEGPKGVAVVFYALRTHHHNPKEQRDTVQLAVDYINQNLALLCSREGEIKPKAEDGEKPPLDALLQGVNPHHQDDPAHQKPLRVLAAMPNWLTAPLHQGAQPPSGPGAPPIAANQLLQGKWKFTKELFNLLMQRTENVDDEVTIIILDTSFAGGEAEIKQKAADLADMRENYLLQQLLADLADPNNKRVTIDTSMTPISDAFRSGLDEYGRPYGYDMVDHGLFVAGIIRGIVPSARAKIEVIRTQNDYGSGEMDLFLGALYSVGDAKKHPNPDHIVLNLSLGVLPPLEELQQIWFGPECCCDGANIASMMEAVDLLQLGVRLPIQRLVEKNVVIVAAAGNDSLGKTPAHGPRIPARYDDVLGVAAVDGECEAAGYSNRGNVLSWGSGIATYGGEQPNDASETLAMLARKQTPPSSADPDAVEGLYLYPTFPPLNADEVAPQIVRNSYGSAWWSGTSFATPIASGLAAHYILDGKRGQGVINALLSDLVKAGAPYEPRLQAPVLEVKQVL